MKQQITKNAIETAFLKLLKERYFEKVMVKDIVEECGLTRNTFYYYYEDTYNIIADILEREIRRIMQEVEAGVDIMDATADVFAFLDENPRLAQHLFASAKKDEIYGYVRSAVEILIRYWLERETKNLSISEADKKTILNIYKYIIQGMIVEWVDGGMKYSIQKEVERARRVFHQGLWLSIKQNNIQE